MLKIGRWIDQLSLYQTQTLVSTVSVLFVEQIPRHTWRFVAGHRCCSSRPGHSSCTACHPLPGPSHFRGESLWVSLSTNQESMWCGYTFISVPECFYWWSKHTHVDGQRHHVWHPQWESGLFILCRMNTCPDYQGY